MDFHLTNEQLMLRKMYREFAENEVKPLAEEVDETEEFPMETVKKMAKLGMMGIYFPKEYGGAGGDVRKSAAPPPLSSPRIPPSAVPRSLNTARKSRRKSICPICSPDARSARSA